MTDSNLGQATEIHHFTTADYAVLSVLVSRLRPDTPLSESQLHAADAAREPHLNFGGFLATKGGQAVGLAWYTQYADYYQPTRAVIFGGVLPEYRQRGLGNQLLSTLEPHLSGLGITHLETEVSETDQMTLAFLSRRDFSVTWRRVPYQLEVAQARIERLEPLRDGLKAQGIRVVLYDDLSGDPERDEKLRALNWRLEQDVPYGETPTELSLETFVRERLERPEVLKDAFFVALQGQDYIGMSSLWRRGTSLKRDLETEFTGVLPTYRGRGLATLLKLSGVHYAQKHGYAELRTTNDATNAAMRRVNERLGFRAQPALLRLEKIDHRVC